MGPIVVDVYLWCSAADPGVRSGHRFEIGSGSRAIAYRCGWLEMNGGGHVDLDHR